MKMLKKIPYFTVCILVLLFSCSKEIKPNPSNQKIEFEANVDVSGSTKGNLINNFPTGGAFGVFNFLYPTSGGTLDQTAGIQLWNTKKNTCKPDEYYNQKITFDGTVCAAQTPISWSAEPKNQYTFFAYYPYEITGSTRISFSSKDTYGAPKITYTLPYTSSSKETIITDLSQMKDFMTAKAIDRIQDMGKIPFNFEHRLFALDFGVNNYNAANKEGETDNNIYIKEVYLKGTFNKNITVSPEDSYTLTSNITTSGSFSGQFEVIKKPDFNTSINVEPNIDKGLFYLTDKNTNNFLILIPQTITDGNYTMEVTYYSDVSTQNSNPSVKKASLPISARSFNAGTKYTLCLDFLGNICALRIITAASWDSFIYNDNIEFE